MNIVGLIISILIGALVSGFIIWIVGKLGLGLEVSGFGAAFIAAIVIAVVSGVGGAIKNYSAYERRRADLVVAMGYDANIGVVRNILMNIMKSHSLVLTDPAPTVEVLDLADNKVNLAVRSWVRTADYWQARCDVLEQVKERFGEAGIEVPYPKQEFRLYQDVRGDAGLPQSQSLSVAPDVFEQVVRQGNSGAD